jgi:hypothetical protein
MKSLAEFDWRAIEARLDLEGQAVLPGLLSAAECDALVALDSWDKGFGDVASLEALLLGAADARYFAKLPALQDARLGLGVANCSQSGGPPRAAARRRRASSFVA